MDGCSYGAGGNIELSGLEEKWGCKHPYLQPV